MLLSQHDHERYITQTAQRRAEKIQAASEQIAQSSAFLNQLKLVDESLDKLRTEHVEVLAALRQVGYSDRSLIQRNAQITQQLAAQEADKQIQLLTRDQILRDAAEATREVLKEEQLAPVSSQSSVSLNGGSSSLHQQNLQTLQANIVAAQQQEATIQQESKFTSIDSKKVDQILQQNLRTSAEPSKLSQQQNQSSKPVAIVVHHQTIPFKALETLVAKVETQSAVSQFLFPKLAGLLESCENVLKDVTTQQDTLQLTDGNVRAWNDIRTNQLQDLVSNSTSQPSQDFMQRMQFVRNSLHKIVSEMRMQVTNLVSLGSKTRTKFAQYSHLFYQKPPRIADTWDQKLIFMVASAIRRKWIRVELNQNVFLSTFLTVYDVASSFEGFTSDSKTEQSTLRTVVDLARRETTSFGTRYSTAVTEVVNVDEWPLQFSQLWPDIVAAVNQFMTSEIGASNMVSKTTDTNAVKTTVHRVKHALNLMLQCSLESSPEQDDSNCLMKATRSLNTFLSCTDSSDASCQLAAESLLCAKKEDGGQLADVASTNSELERIVSENRELISAMCVDSTDEECSKLSLRILEQHVQEAQFLQHALRFVDTNLLATWQASISARTVNSLKVHNNSSSSLKHTDASEVKVREDAATERLEAQARERARLLAESEAKRAKDETKRADELAQQASLRATSALDAATALKTEALAQKHTAERAKATIVEKKYATVLAKDHEVQANEEVKTVQALFDAAATAASATPGDAGIESEMLALKQKLEDANNAAILAQTAALTAEQAEEKARTDAILAEAARVKADEAAAVAELENLRRTEEADATVEAARLAKIEENLKLQKLTQENGSKEAEKLDLQKKEQEEAEAKTLQEETKLREAEQKRQEEETKLREAEETKLREAEETKLREAEETKLREAEETKLREAEETKLREAEETKLREAEETNLREAEKKRQEEENKLRDEAEEAKKKSETSAADALIQPSTDQLNLVRRFFEANDETLLADIEAGNKGVDYLIQIEKAVDQLIETDHASLVNNALHSNKLRQVVYPNVWKAGRGGITKDEYKNEVAADAFFEELDNVKFNYQKLSRDTADEFFKRLLKLKYQHALYLEQMRFYLSYFGDKHAEKAYIELLEKDLKRLETPTNPASVALLAFLNADETDTAKVIQARNQIFTVTNDEWKTGDMEADITKTITWLCDQLNSILDFFKYDISNDDTTTLRQEMLRLTPSRPEYKESFWSTELDNILARTIEPTKALIQSQKVIKEGRMIDWSILRTVQKEVKEATDLLSDKNQTHEKVALLRLCRALHQLRNHNPKVKRILSDIIETKQRPSLIAARNELDEQLVASLRLQELDFAVTNFPTEVSSALISNYHDFSNYVHLHNVLQCQRLFKESSHTAWKNVVRGMSAVLAPRSLIVEESLVLSMLMRDVNFDIVLHGDYRGTDEVKFQHVVKFFHDNASQAPKKHTLWKQAIDTRNLDLNSIFTAIKKLVDQAENDTTTFVNETSTFTWLQTYYKCQQLDKTADFAKRKDDNIAVFRTFYQFAVALFLKTVGHFDPTISPDDSVFTTYTVWLHFEELLNHCKSAMNDPKCASRVIPDPKHQVVLVSGLKTSPDILTSISDSWESLVIWAASTNVNDVDDNEFFEINTKLLDLLTSVQEQTWKHDIELTSSLLKYLNEQPAKLGFHRNITQETCTPQRNRILAVCASLNLNLRTPEEIDSSILKTLTNVQDYVLYDQQKMNVTQHIEKLFASFDTKCSKFRKLVHDLTNSDPDDVDSIMDPALLEKIQSEFMLVENYIQHDTAFKKQMNDFITELNQFKFHQETFDNELLNAMKTCTTTKTLVQGLVSQFTLSNAFVECGMLCEDKKTTPSCTDILLREADLEAIKCTHPEGEPADSVFLKEAKLQFDNWTKKQNRSEISEKFVNAMNERDDDIVSNLLQIAQKDLENWNKIFKTDYLICTPLLQSKDGPPECKASTTLADQNSKYEAIIVFYKLQKEKPDMQTNTAYADLVTELETNHNDFKRFLDEKKKTSKDLAPVYVQLINAAAQKNSTHVGYIKCAHSFHEWKKFFAPLKNTVIVSIQTMIDEMAVLQNKIEAMLYPKDMLQFEDHILSSVTLEHHKKCLALLATDEKAVCSPIAEVFDKKKLSDLCTDSSLLNSMVLNQHNNPELVLDYENKLQAEIFKRDLEILDKMKTWLLQKVPSTLSAEFVRDIRTFDSCDSTVFLGLDGPCQKCALSEMTSGSTRTACLHLDMSATLQQFYDSVKEPFHCTNVVDIRKTLEILQTQRQILKVEIANDPWKTFQERQHNFLKNFDVVRDETLPLETRHLAILECNQMFAKMYDEFANSTTNSQLADHIRKIIDATMAIKSRMETLDNLTQNDLFTEERVASMICTSAPLYNKFHAGIFSEVTRSGMQACIVGTNSFLSLQKQERNKLTSDRKHSSITTELTKHLKLIHDAKIEEEKTPIVSTLLKDDENMIELHQLNEAFQKWVDSMKHLDLQVQNDLLEKWVILADTRDDHLLELMIQVSSDIQADITSLYADPCQVDQKVADLVPLCSTLNRTGITDEAIETYLTVNGIDSTVLAEYKNARDELKKCVSNTPVKSILQTALDDFRSTVQQGKDNTVVQIKFRSLEQQYMLLTAVKETYQNALNKAATSVLANVDQTRRMQCAQNPTPGKPFVIPWIQASSSSAAVENCVKKLKSEPFKETEIINEAKTTFDNLRETSKRLGALTLNLPSTSGMTDTGKDTFLITKENEYKTASDKYLNNTSSSAQFLDDMLKRDNEIIETLMKYLDDESKKNANLFCPNIYDPIDKQRINDALKRSVFPSVCEHASLWPKLDECYRIVSDYASEQQAFNEYKQARIIMDTDAEWNKLQIDLRHVCECYENIIDTFTDPATLVILKVRFTTYFDRIITFLKDDTKMSAVRTKVDAVTTAQMNLRNKIDKKKNPSIWKDQNQRNQLLTLFEASPILRPGSTI